MKSIRPLLGALPLLALAHTANADGNTAPVVFVCEHGVAKA